MIKIITMPFRAIAVLIVLIVFSPVILVALVIQPDTLSSEILSDCWKFIKHGSNLSY